MDDAKEKNFSLRTWIIVFLLVVSVLVKGFYALLVVQDRGQSGWDYRPVNDVPGESPYAIYQTLPHSQHVKGAEGE